MRGRESDSHKLWRLGNEFDRGWISEREFRQQATVIIERLKSRAAWTKVLKEIDAKYGKRGGPFVQGGLPELGKRR